MLVRDAGDAWQLVLQTDHGDLAGQLVAAWGGERFAPAAPYAAAVLAAVRHDDGWGVWDRRPRLDPSSGAPQNFFGVDVPSHLAFYRAGVEVVCDEDPVAGLLVSMHMSGLYRQRYGVVPSGPMRIGPELRALADRVCDEEEARQAALVLETGIDEAQRWHAYALLQVADFVSLFCGLADLESGAAKGSLDAAPTRVGGPPTAIAISSPGPLRLRFDPHPFAVDALELTMRRRLLPKRPWPDDAALRADFDAAPVETLRIAVER